MTAAHLVALAGYVLAAGFAQVLFKIASVRIEAAETLGGRLFDPVLLAALALYGGLSVAWLILLRGVPLSALYPFLALGFIVTPILAAALLGERLTPTYAVGLALICAGVIVTQKALHGA